MKTTSKIIPLNQHKFQTLNQNKEARRKLGGEYAYEQQSKFIPPCFDSSKHAARIECYKKFTISSNLAKRKSEGEGTSTLNKPQESAKITGRCKAIISKRVQDLYIQCRHCSHFC